ncbi:MAG: large conductance mechanosensitive channel protein MscL [Thermoflexales bacterium]|nr:large conductance mechanosensitive channel protein MscL [Thermoflexales bacterium]
MNKPVPQAPGMLGEFQRFLTKTNAIALAIGVIIGGASTKLVSALVEDLINPLIGKVLAGLDLASLKVSLGQGMVDGKATDLYLKYGHFISTIVDFIIVMAVVYILIKIFAKDMLDK